MVTPTTSYPCRTMRDHSRAAASRSSMSPRTSLIDALSDSSFDSPSWLAGARTLAVFNTSHQLQTLTGASLDSGFTSGDLGDDSLLTLLHRLRLRFEPGYAPAGATVALSSKMDEGDALIAGPGAAMENGKFDVLNSARFHRAAFSFTGAVRVLAMAAELRKEGEF